jgi:ribosome-associated protein
VNSRVSLRIRLGDLEGLSEAELRRLRETLGPRLTGEGELVLSSGEERSQRINQERVFARAEALIGAGARLPKRRRPVKPSRAAREERLRSKKIRGRKKAGRRVPGEEI